MLGEQMLEYIKIKFQDHWYPERPAKGSAYRSIRISKEKVDKVLINAVIDVGLDLQEILDTLPNDLTIWIDPGEVSYRIGEKGQGTFYFFRFNKHPICFAVEILYNDKKPLIQDSESSSDSEEVSNNPSWANPFSTPVLSAQSFAQTKFGSLKIKHPLPKNKLK
jgi:hypothetical protein